MADKADGKPPADRYPDSEGPFAGPNNTFPLNTAGRVRNAWARIHQGPTRANHSAAEIAGIIAKIRARAKELGIELEESDDTPRALAPPSSIERRTTIYTVELRATDDGAPGRKIGGYAAVFNSDSRNLGPFVERLIPSFFDQEQRNGWPGLGAGVLCRYNHKSDYLLGSTRSGTLRLAVDGTGLDYTVDVPESRGDVFELAQRHDLNGSSFAFIVAADGCEWGYNDVGVTQRTLIEGQLIDVAPVSEPAAYPDATVGLRSLAEHMHADPEDVYVLAAQHELRRLFIRTDQAPPPAPDGHGPAPVPAGATNDESAPQLELPIEDDPAVTLSWQEAKLRLFQLRPHDPINPSSK